MFLKRLFGQSTEPSRSTSTPEQLIETALTDPDSAARRDACHALADLGTLRRVAADDAIAGIRDLAAARYRKLLCGLDPDSPALAERLAEVQGLDDQAVLAQVASQATDGALRLAAIDALASAQALVDCAVDDPLADNRLRAAERIEGRTALEQLARRIGKRDKRIYRLARQRLKELAERDERPRLVRARAEAICEKLERLGRFDNWVQDHALLGHLEGQWAELRGDADAEISERYAALRQRFLDAYAAYAEANAAQLAAEQARAAASDYVKALAAELAELTKRDDLEAVAERLKEIEHTWAEIQADTDVPATAARDLRDALAQARAQRDRLTEHARHARAAERIVADARALLDAGEVERKRLKDLRKRLDRLTQDAGTTVIPADCAELIERLQHRVDKHRDHVARKLAALPERLAELDQHFEAGRLKKAEPLYQSILATLEQARAAELPRADLAPAEAHLKQIVPQLRELQRWRRWGTDTKREDLCTEIERLADDAEHELEPLANRLHELREAWRGLDRDAAPTDEALRQRFQAAAERIHERCRPFLEAQAKLRAASRAERQALCDQLQAFLDQVDWERVDWKKAARAEREMRQAWAALGPLEGRHHRALEGRFRKLLRRLDKALDEERGRNRALKQDLIERMRALADEPDLRSAIDAAKALQQQWHTTVPGRQRDENALWREFRAASDAVFARRAEQHQARTAEIRENQAAREALCDELAALAGGAADAAALTSGLRELETRWRDTEGLALPRQAVPALRKRWKEARDVAHERLRALESAERWAAVERLEQRAAYCDERARQLLADGAGDADALRAGWAALPVLDERSDDHGLGRRLDGAFEQLLEATADDAARERLARTMEANAERRLNLCLHLEITAGVPSPPELEQRRMELQVSRLRDHMGGGDNDPYADASRLLREWYLCTPCAATGGLDARFARIKQALSEDQSAAA